MSTIHTGNSTTGIPSSTGSSRPLDAIKKDASALKDDLGALKSDTAHLTAHATEHAIDAVKARAESAADVAKSFGASAKKIHGSACDTVSARPMTSVLVAAGVGVVIGRLLAGR